MNRSSVRFRQAAPPKPQVRGPILRLGFRHSRPPRLRAGGIIASTLGATSEQLGRDDAILAGVMAAATADKIKSLLERKVPVTRRQPQPRPAPQRGSSIVM